MEGQRDKGPGVQETSQRLAGRLLVYTCSLCPAASLWGRLEKHMLSVWLSDPR